MPRRIRRDVPEVHSSNMLNSYFKTCLGRPLVSIDAVIQKEKALGLQQFRAVYGQ